MTTLSVTVINDPGKVLPQRVDWEDLVTDIHRLAAESFEVPLAEKSLDSLKQHVLEVNALALVYDQDKLVGFASMQMYAEHRALYLNAICVDPLVKGKGVARLLIQSLLVDYPVSLIAFTTQNPVMFCFLRSLARRVFPNPDDRIFPLEFRRLQKLILEKREGKVETEASVIRGLYPSCRYSRIPASSDVSINSWFAEILGITNGKTRDGFLFLGLLEA